MVGCKKKRNHKSRAYSTAAQCTLTGDDVSLVQAKLTALEDLIRPARLAPLRRVYHLVILLRLLLLRLRLRTIEFGRDDLEVVMMGLVDVVGHVDVAVERARRLQESRRGVLEPLADEILGEGRAEAEVVDYVGDVRHVRR